MGLAGLERFAGVSWNSDDLSPQHTDAGSMLRGGRDSGEGGRGGVGGRAGSPMSPWDNERSDKIETTGLFLYCIKRALCLMKYVCMCVCMCVCV